MRKLVYLIVKSLKAVPSFCGGICIIAEYIRQPQKALRQFVESVCCKKPLDLSTQGKSLLQILSATVYLLHNSHLLIALLSSFILSSTDSLRSWLVMSVHMYRGLCWVFVAVGVLSLVVVQTSHYRDFSHCGLKAQGHSSFSSCGTQALLPHGMWNLLGTGIKPRSPALAGGSLAIGPPGKFIIISINKQINAMLKQEHCWESYGSLLLQLVLQVVI